MLTKVSAPDQEVAYGYDSLDRRILKTTGDHQKDTIRYLYDGLNVLQEITGTNSQKITAYYRANNMITASQGYNISQGNYSYQNRPNGLINYYAHDGQGSVAALSNHQGKSTERHKYDAFGELRQGDLTHNPYGFTGKRYDTESGLYQFHFRKYDPATGVWTTPDPIDIVGGLNLYGYVMNDPVNLVDPDGLIWKTVGYNYHGKSNTTRFILNRVTNLIGTGLDCSIGGSDPRELEGLQRDLIQEWVSDNDLTKSYRDVLYKIGTQRTIIQTFTQKPYPGPGETFITSPASHYWSPQVSDWNYDIYDTPCEN